MLAEGVVLADNEHDFNAAYSKFNEAKEVYPLKVEPYVYIAMTTIRRANLHYTKDETKKAEAYIDALK